MRILLGIYPGKTIRHLLQLILIGIIIEALFIVANIQKQLRCPTKREGILNYACPYYIILYRGGNK